MWLLSPPRLVRRCIQPSPAALLVEILDGVVEEVVVVIGHQKRNYLYSVEASDSSS